MVNGLKRIKQRMNGKRAQQKSKTGMWNAIPVLLLFIRGG